VKFSIKSLPAVVNACHAQAEAAIYKLLCGQLGDALQSYDTWVLSYIPAFSSHALLIVLLLVLLIVLLLLVLLRELERAAETCPSLLARCL